MNDTTRQLIADASNGPGPDVKRFVSAAPAKPGKLTPAQIAALHRFDGQILGYVSKALVYDVGGSISERRSLASLVKGGILEAHEVPGPIPGAAPYRVGGQGPRHYVLRLVSP